MIRSNKFQKILTILFLTFVITSTSVYVVNAQDTVQVSSYVTLVLENGKLKCMSDVIDYNCSFTFDSKNKEVGIPEICGDHCCIKQQRFHSTPDKSVHMESYLIFRGTYKYLCWMKSPPTPHGDPEYIFIGSDLDDTGEMFTRVALYLTSKDDLLKVIEEMESMIPEKSRKLSFKLFEKKNNIKKKENPNRKLFKK